MIIVLNLVKLEKGDSFKSEVVKEKESLGPQYDTLTGRKGRKGGHCEGGSEPGLPPDSCK